jgi:hypothetical protein
LEGCSIAFVVLLLLYYVKITYFAVGMAAVAVARLVPGPVQANKKYWFLHMLLPSRKAALWAGRDGRFAKGFSA